MAKGFVGLAIKAAKAADRERVRKANAAVHEQKALLKDKARQAKAREASTKRASVSNERERKAWDKEDKAAHVRSLEAEVDLMNAQVNDMFDEVDGLLEATIDVDDYIDLKTLLRPEATTPFDRPELEKAAPPPLSPRLPSKPKYREPPQPKGFFGKKKKLAAAIQSATETQTAAHKKWEKIVANLQSCGKANKVIVYSYGGRTAEMWWEKLKNNTTRFDNLQVMNFSQEETRDLGELANRSMKVQVNIQDGEVMVGVDDRIVYVTPIEWKNAA
jgi:hypothetical protein